MGKTTAIAWNTVLVAKTTVSKTTVSKTTVSKTTPAITVLAKTTPAIRVAPSRCPSNLATHLSSTRDADQLITVESATYATTYATVTVWRRAAASRCWTRVFGPWTGRIGANGFSDHKVEGDDTTPTGAFGVGPVMYGNAADPGVAYPYRRLVCGDWWDETSSSPQYNTFQHVPCGHAPPFGGDSEALWEETAAYPSFAVIDYNASPIVPGAGSAIFFHATLGEASEGCVTIPRAELDRTLRWLRPAAHPLIVMGPAAEIERF
jgi:L,D-peptidoglycan transpeptidase YkuD (ErfK/YbiS/YcfS/YnhG family)